MTNSPKHIAILGSTGSIGTQAAEVIHHLNQNKKNPLFEISVLTANENADGLIAQAKKIKPRAVVIGNKEKYSLVKNELAPLGMEVLSGKEGFYEVVQSPEINIVLTAMVGFAGLLPTIYAIKAGKNIALANKETLVVAGEIITQLAKEKIVHLCPVDSEHSAIFQCLVGEENNRVEKIYLTASGGPFRGYTKDRLRNVTIEEALNHPNWNMGDKITIDSATMMNKGLEIIEAKWLFGLESGQIDVVIHPQSVIHSIVQFEDGSMKAQMGLPDMKLPIQYALGYPSRMKNNFPRFDFAKYSSLTFERPDEETFRCLKLARHALEKGGNAPCVLNGANEIAVQSFLKGKINFTAVPEIIEDLLAKISFIANPSLEDLEETDKQTRAYSLEMVHA